MSTIAERRARLAQKLDVWLGRGGRRAFNRKSSALPSGALRLAAPPGVPPSPPGGRAIFTKHTPQEELWLFAPVRLLGCQVASPPHLWLSAEPAWRRTEVP